MACLERLRKALRFEPTDHIPVAPLLGAHAVAQAGLSYEAASADPQEQAKALLQAVEVYQPDAVFTLMDLSAEPEALGAGVGVSASGVRVVTRHLAPEALLTDDLERVILTARVPVFVETVRLLRTALGDTVMVGALISGPLTAAANAVGIETVVRMLRRRRGALAEMLTRLTEACFAVAAQHIEAGAHGLAFLEPCATSSLLGPEDFRELLLPHLQGLADYLRVEQTISILHVCGDCRASLPLLAESGFDALSLDAPVDFPKARRRLGRRVALMGNVEAHQLLRAGSTEIVLSSASALVREMGREGGLILSGGCELSEDTPRENVAALIAAARGATLGAAQD